MDMQQKLTEIAEIPKILYSTLTTVSATFDKLLSVNQISCLEGNSNFGRVDPFENNQPFYDRGSKDKEASPERALLSSYLEQERELKEATPESDYISDYNCKRSCSDKSDSESEPELESDSDNEVGYSSGTEDVNLDNGSDGETIDYHFTFPIDFYGSNYDHDKDCTDESFKTATYTWKMKRVSKPSTELQDDQKETDGPKDFSNTEMKQVITDLKNEKICFKLDNQERTWPWADPKKMIYKQSTCHLVRTKPLGIIESRMKLLLKSQAFEQIRRRN